MVSLNKLSTKDRDNDFGGTFTVLNQRILDSKEMAFHIHEARAQ